MSSYNHDKLLDMYTTAQAIKRKILRAYENVDSVDVKNMIKICDILPESNISQDSPDILIDSPQFNSTVKRYCKTDELLQCPDFLRKYNYVVSLVYAILKLKVPLFEEIGKNVIIKSNREVIKAIEAAKKAQIKSHIMILHTEFNGVKSSFSPGYEKYSNEFIKTVRQLDRVKATMEKLMSQGVWTDGDNVMSLVLPYFYKYLNILERFD